MDFTYDDEQLALAGRGARCARARMRARQLVRQLADDPTGITPALWSHAGRPRLDGPPRARRATAAAAPACSRCASCSSRWAASRCPVRSSPPPVAATLAARALGATELLADLASGARRGTMRWASRATASRWTRCGRGRAARPPSGCSPARSPSSSTGTRADWAIVVARSEEGVRSYLLESPDGDAGARRSTRPASWPASCSTTRRSSRSGPSGNQAGAVAAGAGRHRHRLAAETVGAADRALAEAIAYTSERIVFDKPVATYQTVRHRLVEMFQQVEMARAGFQFAAWASDTESPEREQAAAMAASYAAEAGVRVTGDDIQLHGGVGFTWANDAHFLFKRVKQNELLAGGAGAAAPPAGVALHRVGVND